MDRLSNFFYMEAKFRNLEKTKNDDIKRDENFQQNQWVHPF